MCWFLVENSEEENLGPIERLHKMTLEMARSSELPRLLSDLQSPAVREELKKDPMTGLKIRNIKVPDRATVELRQPGADGWEIEARVVEKDFVYIVGFNNKTGFFTRILGPNMQQKAAG